MIVVNIYQWRLFKMNCIFCEISAGTIPSKKVYEDDHVLAFYDIEPNAPEHVLVIPKKHIASLNDVSEGDWGLMGDVLRVVQQVAKKLGVEESGYRLINCTGEDGGQTVFHIHFHLLGGAKIGPLNSNYGRID